MKRLISAAAVAAVATMAFASVASANVVPSQPTNSLTATTVYNGVTYVQSTRSQRSRATTRSSCPNMANSPVGINESVSGTLKRRQHQHQRRVPRRIRLHLELQRPAHGRHRERQPRPEVAGLIHDECELCRRDPLPRRQQRRGVGLLTHAPACTPSSRA